MKKKVIFKRMCALLSALVVCVSAFLGDVPFYAGVNLGLLTSDMFSAYDVSNKYTVNTSNFPDCAKGKPWIIFTDSYEDYFYLYVLDSPNLSILYSSSTSKYNYYYFGIHNKSDYTNSVCYCASSLSSTWKDMSSTPYNMNLATFIENLEDVSKSEWRVDRNYFVASNCNLNIMGISVYGPSSNHNDENIEDDSKDDDIGYLKDISHSITYARGTLYNYNEDSRTDRWSFSNLTTTDLDLSQGGYTIRHYVRPVLVKGYEDDDVIEKLDKYYVGDYDASVGYVQYLDKDLVENLESQGYDGIGFVDAYLLGRFILQWHYFEIIDNETGASGGYICLKPKDVDEKNFGTEYEVIAVDDDDNVDESYEKDIAYRGEGSYVKSEGETIEDAFERAEVDVVEQEEHTNIVNLNGLDSFVNSLNALTDSTDDVTDAIGGFFDCLPSWVLVVFGLSVALSFLLFLIKILR